MRWREFGFFVEIELKGLFWEVEIVRDVIVGNFVFFVLEFFLVN